MAVGEEDIAQRDTLALDEGGELVGGIGGVDELSLIHIWSNASAAS